MQAPFPAAAGAGHIHFHAGFGEGKKAGPKAHARLLAEHGLQKGGQRAAQVGQGDFRIDQQALDLVEHGRMRHVRVAAVHLARRDDGQGRPALEHGADLHGGRVGAQHHLVLDVQGVLHIAGRVFGGHVERLETVEIGVHLGAGHHLVPHAPEYGAHVLHGQGDGVQRPGPGHAARQAGVEAGQQGRFLFPLQTGLAFVYQCGQLLLDLVGRLAEHRALGRRQFGQAGHEFGQPPLAAQKIHPAAFQLR